MRTIARTMLCVFLVGIPVVLMAQVPNAGFENWSGGEADGWASSNAPPVYTNVTQSATAHSGNSAVKGEVVSLYTVPMSATIQSGPGGHGFAYAARPASVTGWYQFSATGNDRFGVNVALFKGGEGGTLVALAASADPTLHASYTQFDVPFVYYTPDIPDLCIMQFSVALPFQESAVHVGSYFLIDDLALSGTTEVAEAGALPAAFRLDQNFPNPFNPSTMISYQLPVAGNVRLTVYDLMGKEVATLVNERKEAGRYQVTFNAVGVASGIYLCRIQAGGFVQTTKMTLVR
jgi:hypothetical protein